MRKEVIKFARIVESEDSFYLLRIDFNKETNNYDLIIERCIDDFGNLIEWCICVFENGSFGVRYIIRFDDGRAVTGFTPFINCINVHKNMKIIGNIHDNPEMIENKR